MNDGPAQTRAFALTASEDGIRHSLAQICAFLSQAELTADARGTAQIILAEALNNVAEHAYAASGAGRIDVTVTLDAQLATITIIDSGAPLSGLTPPAGDPPALDDATGDLPEGGFGWFLIRRLTSDLSYNRTSGQNRLSLQFSTISAPSARTAAPQ